MATSSTSLAPRPTLLRAQEAAKTLEKALRGFRGDLTVADAAEKGGLALRDAETGLHELVSRYQGHLGATSKGELLFRFPRGLVKPNSGTPRWLKKVGRAAAGVGRFVVRAWVSVVVVGYALVFGALLIAMALKDDRDGDGVGTAVAVVFRVIAEALFWTFHPFSPFYRHSEPNWLAGGRRRKQPKIPFYERVNKFVFGPPPTPEPTAQERQSQLAAEIRQQNGRVGVADVMRVTGLSRDEADAVLSRLLLDFDGEIEVTEDGALVYVFKQLRQTALERSETAAPAPFWRTKATASPVTGNPAGSNLLIGGLNAFNILGSGYALANGLTIERLIWQLQTAAEEARGIYPIDPPPEGVPLVLGLIPFVFSSALFILPALRSFRARSARRRAEAENGRRAVAAHVLEAGELTYPEAELLATWKRGAGRDPASRELLQAVQSLGGDFDLEGDASVFRFSELAREREALVRARRQALGEERSAGQLVFSSDQ